MSSDKTESRQECWVFDFDKTLTRRDTTLPLMLFGSEGVKRYFRCLVYFCLAALQKAGMINIRQVKQFLLKWFFGTFSQEQWLDHCRQFATTIEFSNLYYKTDWKNPEIRFIIVTASPTDMVRPCFEESVLVLGSALKFSKKGVSGLQTHLAGEAKREALIAYGIDSIDRFYSDHPSDMPVAKMAREVYWVEKW